MMTDKELNKRDRRLNLKNLADSILELLEEVGRLEELEQEHQKLNGELREENKKLREILEGKSIQEMGGCTGRKNDGWKMEDTNNLCSI